MRNDSLMRRIKTHNEPACIEKIDSHMVAAYPRRRPLVRLMTPINVVQTAPILDQHTFIPVVSNLALHMEDNTPNNQTVYIVFLQCLIIPEYKSDISYMFSWLYS